MHRRTILRRIGAASALAAGASGGAAGAHDGECHGIDDPDCRFLRSRCSEIDCPDKCCECRCIQ